MNPGERLNLKKEIAQTLAQQDGSTVDLTLDEFGFQTNEFWSGIDRQAYVLEMLKPVTDGEALTQLHAYLHPTAVAAAPPQPETFDDPSNPWTDNGLRLFLTHVSDDAERAGAIRAELGKRSVDAFVAHDSIEPTEEWKKVILYALRTCDACLAFLSPGFSESVWCDQEVGFCMARNRLVIPVEFGVTPYGFLGEFQALPVKRGQSERDISLAVFELLIRKEQSREAMARALVKRWADTNSYDAARENYGFLKKIPAEAWSQPLVDQVAAAQAMNPQLIGASIEWQPSEEALQKLFADLPYDLPANEAAAPF